MPARYRVEHASIEGISACVLHDDRADLHATWALGAGMLGASLVHRGQELLWQGAGAGAYAREGKFMGIPFLHPWANRLEAFAYELGGHDVELDRSSPILKLDEHGLPIHGLLTGDRHWLLRELTAGPDRARLVALLDFDRPELLAAFPFRHRVEIEVGVAGGELRVATTLTATGEERVPISFGFHPYLQIPDAPRTDWRIAFPVRRRRLLDQRGIPTGATEPVNGLEGAIADRTWDDAFDEIVPPRRFDVVGGGRTISLHYDENYPVAQIFAPAGQEYVCVEPMTAPTNSLRVPDQGLRWASAGESWSAVFRITCAARS
jgi:aldose 1-epimerase